MKTNRESGPPTRAGAQEHARQEGAPASQLFFGRCLTASDHNNITSTASPSSSPSARSFTGAMISISSAG